MDMKSKLYLPHLFFFLSIGLFILSKFPQFFFFPILFLSPLLIIIFILPVEITKSTFQKIIYYSWQHITVRHQLFSFSGFETCTFIIRNAFLVKMTLSPFVQTKLPFKCHIWDTTYLFSSWRFIAFFFCNFITIIIVWLVILRKHKTNEAIHIFPLKMVALS